MNAYNFRIDKINVRKGLCGVVHNIAIEKV